jgi:outer membrane protein assembly factor BamB
MQLLVVAAALLGAAAPPAPSAPSGAAPAPSGNVLWTGPHGTPEGRSSLRLAFDLPDPGIREWHYLSKPGRRYRPGQAIWASPALASVGGRPTAFIGGCDQRMHALDLLDKRPLWIKLTGGAIGAAPAVGLVGGEPAVFWGSSDRHVYACFADGRGEADGRMAWPPRELVPASSTQDEAELTAPLLLDGRLYIGCFVYDKAPTRSSQTGWLFCLDAATGRTLWQQEVSQGPVGDPAGCLVDGRPTVFICARKGQLQAWDVSGSVPRPLWKYQMPHEVLAPPALDTGGGREMLFLGSKYGDLHAIDARTGRRVWKRMTGNWIDNGACVGTVDGERLVFVGSHDYCLYALSRTDGAVRWRTHLGGEVYSAPALFEFAGRPRVAAATLGNRLFVLDAADGAIFTSFHTGTPVWDKAPKGETVWGSPAVLEAGRHTAIVHGSFSDFVYVYPVDPEAECDLRSTAQSPATLWRGLLVTLLLFGGVVLPLVLWLPERRRAER